MTPADGAPDVTEAATATPESAGDIPPAGVVYRSADGPWMMESGGETQRLFDHPNAMLSRNHTLYLTEGEAWPADTTAEERRPLIPDEERLTFCASWWAAQTDAVLATSWPAGMEGGLGGDILAGYPTAVDVASGDYRVLDAKHGSLGRIAPAPGFKHVIAYGGGATGWLYDWDEERIEPFDPADDAVVAAWWLPVEE